MDRNFPELRIKSTLVQVRDQEHNMSSKTDLMMSITADIFFTNGPWALTIAHCNSWFLRYASLMADDLSFHEIILFSFKIIDVYSP